MTCFMVGDCLLFGRIKDKGFLLKATNDTLDGLFKMGQFDGGSGFAGSCGSRVSTYKNIITRSVKPYQ